MELRSLDWSSNDGHYDAFLETLSSLPGSVILTVELFSILQIFVLEPLNVLDLNAIML